MGATKQGLSEEVYRPIRAGAREIREYEKIGPNPDRPCRGRPCNNAMGDIIIFNMIMGAMLVMEDGRMRGIMQAGKARANLLLDTGNYSTDDAHVGGFEQCEAWHMTNRRTE